MKLEEIIQLDKEYYMNTFGDRVPVSFTKGYGLTLEDTEGRIFKDFFSGIAVSLLGHGHPRLVKTICEQASNLIHCSNYYYVENQALLAQMLSKMTCGDRFFFSNSGAEANETAIKLARAYYRKKGYSDKYQIISMKNSFHGRTITTLAATGQVKYREPFEPVTPGFINVPMNDMDTLINAIEDGSKICAIMLEPIQGESGINSAEVDYMKRIRGICDEKDILLIMDEVQSGLGRTGKFLASEHFGVEPDIFTVAKGLGGGIPIGATGAKNRVALSFSPGDHGSTFGGNPLACAAALAVLIELSEGGLMENAASLGEYLKEQLERAATSLSIVKEVRGKGLMLGIEYFEPVASAVKNKMFEAGFLVGASGDSVTRLLPPLIVSESDVDDFIPAYINVLKEVQNS